MLTANELKEDEKLITRDNIVFLERTMDTRRKYCEANGHHTVERNTHGIKRTVCTTCGLVHGGGDDTPSITISESVKPPAVPAPLVSKPPIPPVDRPLFDIHKG